MLKGTLIKTSLVDFPTRVAATYFLSGCNIRCPYCYNHELVLNNVPNKDLIDVESVFDHLKKRKKVLTGFVITGGEPLIHQQIPQLIERAKDLGYAVKLDTNGLFPEKLADLFESHNTTPDYVAIDIKTSPHKYNLLQYTENAFEQLTKTIKILENLPDNSKEFRTVLCPPLVEKEDIKEMASMLPSNARWFFAPFRNDNCLDPTYNKTKPYSQIQMEEIVTYAHTLIENTILR